MAFNKRSRNLWPKETKTFSLYIWIKNSAILYTLGNVEQRVKVKSIPSEFLNRERNSDKLVLAKGPTAFESAPLIESSALRRVSDFPTTNYSEKGTWHD